MNGSACLSVLEIFSLLISIEPITANKATEERNPELGRVLGEKEPQGQAWRSHAFLSA